jgi:hypothetical protein
MTKHPKSLMAPRPAIELLESRRLMSTATIRVAAYNIEDDVNGVSAPRPGLIQVLEGIGAESVNGVAKPLDILALEETTSNDATIAPIVAGLNNYYGDGTYAMSTYQATESDGYVGTGNGPSGLIYNTHTLKLLASAGVGTPLGHVNGELRQVVRYEFSPIGGAPSSEFFVYVSHAKSGSTATDALYRGEEAAIVRADAKTLSPGARILYVGDFNSSSVSETYYQTLTAPGHAQAFDAANPTNANLGTTPPPALLTESATGLTYRDDYQFMTGNVLNDAAGGLSYVAGSYHAFGNNGSVPFNGAINSSSNTALPGLANRKNLLNDLTTASDHLPIVADYTDYVAGSSKVIDAFSVAGQTGSGAGTLVPIETDLSAISTTPLTRGLGVQVDPLAPNNALGGQNWADTAADAIANSQSLTFGITVAEGQTLSLSSISLHYRRDAGGPTDALWQYQLNGGAWTNAATQTNLFRTTSKKGSTASITLSSLAALQHLPPGTTVNLRLLPFNATSSSGGFYIFNEPGNDLELDGVVS